MHLHSFSPHSIKSRVAEVLIKELFLASDYSVYHYGKERKVPGLVQLSFKTDEPKDRLITQGEAWFRLFRPDFVVQGPGSKKRHFVEVKYRSSGTFDIEDLEGEYPWPHAFFIVVSPDHIKCLTYKELAEGKAITPTCDNLLIHRKDLELDRNLIVECGTIVKKLFTGV